ncbi:MAG: Uracil phosphoribosyltransferase [candidate division WS2 bacterium]|uniref:Uracil phosphoribosyltransferase n=1 Tax=Psychracetigena formicireducens TaxID=2986056 RepID=A0A9E2F5G6_PSYF1|nr:Uracil phosphoribosyltransferase [Candidatus Psychracetigena formicireducens]
MVKNIGESNSLLNRFIAELRNVDIQKDRLRFRRNLERIGEIFAYEISKNLEYSKISVTTPLGISEMLLPAEEPVIATIMRAGLPFHNGLLSFFDNAENAFISAYRKYNKDGTFTIQFEHLSAPPIDDKIVILNDVMLASGSSLVLSYQALLGKGIPRHTHMVSIIASKEGISYIRRHLPMKNITLWVGAIDDELTVKGYIVPGIGDAGDLAFGDK